MFEPADFIGGNAALDFANAVNGDRESEPQERFFSYSDVLDWCAAGSILPKGKIEALQREAKAHPHSAEKVFKRVMELREAIWRVFLALSRGKNASAADIERINDELGPALSHARVHKHGDGFHWDWNDDIALDTPLWIPARATAELLIEGKFDRLHSCASPTCGWLFLDQTRNNSRRWCDMKGCGNRAKVRRFRAQS